MSLPGVPISIRLIVKMPFPSPAGFIPFVANYKSRRLCYENPEYCIRFDIMCLHEH